MAGRRDPEPNTYTSSRTWGGESWEKGDEKITVVTVSETGLMSIVLPIQKLKAAALLYVFEV